MLTLVAIVAGAYLALSLFHLDMPEEGHHYE